MIAALRTLLDRVDGIPEKRLLWVNAGLASLVGIAHGGALAITYSKPTPDAEGIRHLAAVSLPIAVLLLITAVVALPRTDLRRKVLAIHGVAFCVGAASLLVWALSILVNGIPEGNFSWSVGLLTASVAYSVFLGCRFSLPAGVRAHPAIVYAPLWALAIAAVVDVGVFLRLMGEIGAQVGD